jgi:hypothetical protein
MGVPTICATSGEEALEIAARADVDCDASGILLGTGLSGYRRCVDLTATTEGRTLHRAAFFRNRYERHTRLMQKRCGRRPVAD